MLSNSERGRAFQLHCRDALKQTLGREVDLEVPIDIGGNKPHSFDLATRERDIFAECKAFCFTKTGNIPSAKITTLREAAMYLRFMQANVGRLLIIKEDFQPTTGESLARYFARLNANHLEGVAVLEMPEDGGRLTCVHGRFPKTWPLTPEFRTSGLEPCRSHRMRIAEIIGSQHAACS
jgi:hypothetical protein